MARPEAPETPAPLFPEEAYAPAPWDSSARAALRALDRGEANQLQQKAALHWIIWAACRTYDQPYRPTGPGDTAFACGRQFVGQQIIAVLNSKPLQERDREDGRRDQK